MRAQTQKLRITLVEDLKKTVIISVRHIAIMFLAFLFLLSSCDQVKKGKTEGDKIDSGIADSPYQGDTTPLPEQKTAPGGTEELDVIYHEYRSNSETKTIDNEEVVRDIFDEALLNGTCYNLLEYLTQQIGSRLSGSPQAAAAVEWGYQVLDTMGIERVWKQGVMVPRWVRGKEEIGRVINSVSRGNVDFSVCALGGSVPTPPNGLTAEVIEVSHFKELEQLGKKNVQGKIVFFNRRMDPRFINTFYAYGNCVDQRWGGAMEAAKYGAVGVIVRSMTLSIDDNPHTGSMGYEDGIPRIPAMAVSTKGAIELSQLIKEQDDLRFYMKLNSHHLPEVLSYNVVGEIRGSEHPEEIVLVGGHLDSWDMGEGAHDDGAGCVQAMEVLRILRDLKIRPKRTVRVVLFMNEENGLRGGKKYAEIASIRGENHIAAIETDRGGFAPRLFTVEANDQEVFKTQYEKLRKWIPVLREFGIDDIKQGGSGADISPLKEQGTLLFGLVPESQRYFDYHHSDADTFDKVNKRELELGAASLASLVWLLSEHGI